MVIYHVEITGSAERQLRKLARSNQLRVARALVGLATEPFPTQSRKIAGTQDVWRIRVGSYRILYSVDNDRVVVIILKIGHRKDVYR